MDILDKLEQYCNSDYVPMHMPGGKRNPEYSSTSILDITEIDGFDNMHNPEGIIKNAFERAARLYGADETLFLVNGSTSGILAAICGAVRKHDKVAVARNCHVSVYNALLLAELEPVYIIPDIDHKTGIYKGITYEDVKKCVHESPDIKAVIITSPTYEGIVSETRHIAEYLHSKGIILIVDEAHGAHFKFNSEFPESAVDAGADLVINSIHKTLPALTQTALLHISKKNVDVDRVERYWNIYQTTSPSYILMASIDRCIGIIEENGKELFEKYICSLKLLRQKLGQLNNISLLDSDDISKIILLCDNGKILYDRLLNEFRIQPEMASFKYVICMTSIADKQEYYDRLLQALEYIDSTWESHDVITLDKNIYINNAPDMRMTPSQAMELMNDHGCDEIDVCDDSIYGRVSASTVLIYPPGMPVINIGEVITQKAAYTIRNAIRTGLEVPGLKEGRIQCLR